ncbi:MAG: ATP-binding cassette domain-containing protein [Acidobacteriota bacterium]|nr:ATP-binding cassette domain-containing protein [Acidobacteriota bacterium]
MSDSETTHPAVEFEHVTTVLSGRAVLDDVSFSIAPGDAVCVLGKSGTGKSVTLKTIMGLMTPDAGRVFVQGRAVTDASRDELSEIRQHLGFLFQNAALFDSITVGENVAFPLRRHTDLVEGEIEEIVAEKLADVGLESAYDKMPSELSGGMKKRVGLARAMALEPAVLLVDEPSAGLDPITADEIDDLLCNLRDHGTTLLVVTHNIPSARKVGRRLMVLDDGRIIADGTVDDMDRSELPLVREFMRSKGSG